MAKISRIDVNQPIKTTNAVKTGKRIGTLAGLIYSGAILFKNRQDIFVNSVKEGAELIGKNKYLALTAGVSALSVTGVTLISRTIGGLIGKIADHNKSTKMEKALDANRQEIGASPA